MHVKPSAATTGSCSSSIVKYLIEALFSEWSKSVMHSALIGELRRHIRYFMVRHIRYFMVRLLGAGNEFQRRS